MSLRLQPDIENLLWSWLTDQEELTTYVGDRIYTMLPQTKTFPLVRFFRLPIGGPIHNPEIVYDRVFIQFDAYGGRKVDALHIGQTLQALLTQRLRNSVITNGTESAVVSRVQISGLGFQPDPDLQGEDNAVRPRYIFTAEIDIRPAS